MAVVAGLGAGLVAAGGLALLLALAAPERPLRIFVINLETEAELARRDRNARSGSRVGAVATVVGALLLVVAADSWSIVVPAFFAVLAVAACLWFYLALEVRRSYHLVVSSMRTTLGGSPLKRRVSESQAMYVGLGGHYQPGRKIADLPIADPDAALRRAELRSSWRWALAHPLGARGDGM